MTIQKDKLFLLRPGFTHENIPYYCPDCAQIEGLLSFYPHLRTELEVIYVDFPKPRVAIVEELGEAHQGCPMLINKRRDISIPAELASKQHEGKTFFLKAHAIASYLAHFYGIARPAY